MGVSVEMYDTSALEWRGGRERDVEIVGRRLELVGSAANLAGDFQLAAPPGKDGRLEVAEDIDLAADHLCAKDFRLAPHKLWCCWRWG